MESTEMDEIIACLKTASLEKSSEKALPQLKKLSATTEPSACDNLDIKADLLELFELDDRELNMQVAKCIAEIAKNENQRDKYTDMAIIRKLLSFLKDDADSKTVDQNIQACRALGNICFSNDDARNLIKDEQGDEVIYSLLQYKNIGEGEAKLQFIKVRCGVISNYLLGNEDIADRAVDLKLIDKIQANLAECVKDVEKHEDLLLNVLPPLTILTEQVADLIFEPSLNKLLAQILAACTHPDVAESCLALLCYQAQNDDVKLLLAEEGFCETIYKLLETYKTFANTDEAKVLMKMACDLIVLILTGDKSMHYLYKTPLLKYMEEWLDSEDVELLTTGILALGNFARTDSHCIYMVENGIMHKLLAILSKNTSLDDQMTLQHALLSTLKNLVIPKPNKAAVIDAGLVNLILPMLENHQPPIVFKLLGTLRMTIDGQEKLALELLQNEKLIKQLVFWSKNSEFTGVLGESLRLMAWLIKHAYKETSADVDSLKKFILIDGAVESMASMLISSHLVMQNEALLALCIVSTVLNAHDQAEIKLEELLIKADIGEKLFEFIKINNETMTKEIVENLHTFVNILRLSDNLTEHLKKHNIDESLKSIPSLVEYCTL